MEKISYKVLSEGKITQWLLLQRDFTITDIPWGHQNKTVSQIIDQMKILKYSYRVVTRKGWFWAPIAYTAWHRFITRNANWEICKDMIGTGITVSHR